MTDEEAAQLRAQVQEATRVLSGSLTVSKPAYILLIESFAAQFAKAIPALLDEMAASSQTQSSADIAPPGFCDANSDVPVYSRVWMERLARDPRAHPVQIQAAQDVRARQLRWLQETLRRDGAPDWLIQLIAEQW